MSEGKKYLIGFQTGPYSARTQLLCDFEDIKVGDYVVAPAGLGDSAGRVMSVKPYKEGQGVALKKLKKVRRLATAQEIAELEEVFGRNSKDEDDELDPFEKALSKYYVKKDGEDGSAAKTSEAKAEPKAEEDGVTGKLRFVAVILALLAYMYYDKIMALLE